jgi:hypothetical protein
MIRRKCPYCKRPVRVRRDGKLYRHPREQTSDKSIRQWPSAAYPGNVCPGSEKNIDQLTEPGHEHLVKSSTQ